MRSSSAGSKSAARKRGFEMAAGLVERAERGVERLHRRLDQLRRLRLAPLQPADDAGQRRHATNWRRRSTSCASRRSSATFSACIMTVRRSASAVSSPACGRKRVEFLDGVAQPVGFRAGRARPRRGGRRRFFRGAARVPQRGDPRRPRLPGRRRRRAGGDGCRHRPARGRRAGRGSRPAPRRAARSTCTLTGWSLTKARVRPSANWTRRRIRSSSARRCRFRPEQGARRMIAGRRRTRRSPGPAPRPGAPASGVAARAQREREGIEQDRLAGAGLAGEHGKARRRNRCRAGRSGRCRGSKVGTA